MTSLASGPEDRSVSAGHEIRDVNYRAILGLAAALVIGVALVMAGLWYLATLSEAWASREEQATSPRTAHPIAPPAPRLQDAPAADYKAFQAEQQAILDSYGWVDRNQGVVRIPIDRAMELYLANSQPPTTDGPRPAAEGAP